MRTCIRPTGEFQVGLHKPSFQVINLRENDYPFSLGRMLDGTTRENERNFPPGDVCEDNGRWIYEIANPFPFRGTTYIDSVWADSRSADPAAMGLPPRPPCSLRRQLLEKMTPPEADTFLRQLPLPLRYDLAANSTDAEELQVLAHSCCRLLTDAEGVPTGLAYVQDHGRVRADIDDFELFETIANNPHLPDSYKEVMVLRPGVQGDSEIVGEWVGQTHVFEYLRRNSYIPWGHYAANMAHDCIRYAVADLTAVDFAGLRGLYYQRIYVALAQQLDIPIPGRRHRLDPQELESLRLTILSEFRRTGRDHPATLWGWNYGYDFSGSGYRLHASHQMIHQQYAMVPEQVATVTGGVMASFSCGDMVAETIATYWDEYEHDFFDDFLSCLWGNRRMDGRELDASLVVLSDDNVVLFVPKAQVSQWEMQVVVIADTGGVPVGNILEADASVRASLDRVILLAQKIYAAMGARMVTVLEYPKRIGLQNGQRLLVSLLPKLPWSMGAFSEAQLRFICGHYPEDFARACREQLQTVAGDEYA